MKLLGSWQGHDAHSPTETSWRATSLRNRCAILDINTKPRFSTLRKWGASSLHHSASLKEDVVQVHSLLGIPFPPPTLNSICVDLLPCLPGTVFSYENSLTVSARNCDYFIGFQVIPCFVDFILLEFSSSRFRMHLFKEARTVAMAQWLHWRPSCANQNIHCIPFISLDTATAQWNIREHN